MAYRLLCVVVLALVLAGCGEKKVTHWEPTFVPGKHGEPATIDMRPVTRTEEDPGKFSPEATTDVIEALGKRDKRIAEQQKAAQQAAKPGKTSTVCLKHTIGCKCGCPDGRRGITCTCP